MGDSACGRHHRPDYGNHARRDRDDSSDLHSAVSPRANSGRRQTDRGRGSMRASLDTRCRLTALALRAIVGAPLRDQRSPDGRAASHARLAGALVNTVLELEKAAAAIRVYIVGNRGAALLDGLRQDFHHSGVQPFDALRAQPGADRQRMNARPEQRLVGVNVAHAKDEVLIPPRAFDARLAALEPCGELRDGPLQRFRTELLHAGRQSAADLDLPKLALVFVAQYTPVEVHDRMRVASGRAA